MAMRDLIDQKGKSKLLKWLTIRSKETVPVQIAHLNFGPSVPRRRRKLTKELFQTKAILQKSYSKMKSPKRNAKVTSGPKIQEKSRKLIENKMTLIAGKRPMVSLFGLKHRFTRHS